MATSSSSLTGRYICNPDNGATNIPAVDAELAQIQKLFSNYEAADLTMTKVDSLGRPIPRMNPDGTPVVRTFQVRLPTGGIQQRTRVEFDEDEYVDTYAVTPTQFRSIDQDIEDARAAVRDLLNIGCLARDSLMSVPTAASIKVFGRPIFTEEEFARAKQSGVQGFDSQLRARLTLVARKIKTDLDGQMQNFYQRIGNERLRRVQLTTTTTTPTNVVGGGGPGKQTSGASPANTSVSTSFVTEPVRVAPQSMATGGGGSRPVPAPAKRRVSRTLESNQPAMNIVPPPSPFSIPARFPPVSNAKAPFAPAKTPTSATSSGPQMTPTATSTGNAPGTLSAAPKQPNAPPPSAAAPKRRVSRQLGSEMRPQFIIDTHTTTTTTSTATNTESTRTTPPAIIAQPQQQQQQQQKQLPPPAPAKTQQQRRRSRRVIEEEQHDDGQMTGITTTTSGATQQTSPTMAEPEPKRAKVSELPPPITPPIPFPLFGFAIDAAAAAQQNGPSAVKAASPNSNSSNQSPMTMTPPPDNSNVDDDVSPTTMEAALEEEQEEEDNNNEESVSSSVSSRDGGQVGVPTDINGDAGPIGDDNDDDDDDVRSQGGDSVVGSDDMFDVQVYDVSYTPDDLDTDIRSLQNKLRNIELDARRAGDNASVYNDAINRLTQKIETLIAFMKDQRADVNDDIMFPVFFWRVVQESTQGTLNESGPFVTEQDAKEDANMFLREYEARRDGIDRSVFVKASQEFVQQVYQQACGSRHADVQSKALQIQLPSTPATLSAANASSTLSSSEPSRTYIAVALPWTRDLFLRVFKDPYSVFKNRYFAGSDDTIETRRRFIAAYAPAIVYAWSNAFADRTLADTLVHPVYSENILSPDKDVERMNCFGVTVALYAFDSLERPGDTSMAEQFAADLQQVLSVRSREEVAEKLRQVLQQASKLQTQIIPDSAVSLMPVANDPTSVIVNVQCGTNDNQCARYINDLYRLIYANGLKIDATQSSVIHADGALELFVDLLMSPN